jgi:hypothetical protein
MPENICLPSEYRTYDNKGVYPEPAFEANRITASRPFFQIIGIITDVSALQTVLQLCRGLFGHAGKRDLYSVNEECAMVLRRFMRGVLPSRLRGEGWERVIDPLIREHCVGHPPLDPLPSRERKQYFHTIPGRT